MSMDAPKMKTAFRKSVQTKLRSLSADDVKQRSNGIQKLLLSLPHYQQATRIGVYLSMPDGEASTQGIVEHALQNGKQVFVPYLYKNPGISRLEGEKTYMPKRIMNMVSLHSLDDYHSLQRDKWGIPTPAESSIPGRKHVLGDTEGSPLRRSKVNHSLDMIVVPGMAFDRAGRRLGHGRGFYDFFLEEYRTAPGGINASSCVCAKFPVLVALALPEQLLPSGEDIPTEEHDRKVDAIVTDEETVILQQ